MSVNTPALQRIELALFTACFLAFAYFNQGGGWNQNARFAEVRAMVEEGRFAIDNFLVYDYDPAKDDLYRIPVSQAEYELAGQRYRLSWVDMDWHLYPVGDHPLEPGVEKSPMVELCSSGDIGYVPSTGHFHPNKPPGTSFLAAPGYFVIYHIEKACGINPDHWWTLNLNAWLTTVCSVGLISALGCVVFFRLALNLGGAAVPAVLATLVFAFGTTFFPFGTILFDHNLTAVLLLTSFYFLRRTRDGAGESLSERHRHTFFVLAGVCAGMAAVTNYVAAVGGAFLGLYAFFAVTRCHRNFRGAALFSLGVLGPFLLICWYGWVCFGSPFKLSTDFQNPLFKDAGGALGMFALPSGYVATLLLFSPFRGVFYLMPVLALGLYGWVVWLRERRLAPEARICIAIFAFFFLVNASFNGYHAGYSAGPRYLVPGLPFLALPLVVAFSRLRWISVLLGVYSIGVNLLLTATDAQNPVGLGGHARVEGRRTEWSYDLVGDYALPLFISGRAWPLLEEQMVVHMEKENDRIAAVHDDPSEQAREADELRADLLGTIDRGEASPFLLGSIRGPVSVNPLGVFEGLFEYRLFKPDDPQCAWASFNVGELLPPASFWAQSRASLLPLLLCAGGLSAIALWIASRRDSAGAAIGAETSALSPVGPAR